MPETQASIVAWAEETFGPISSHMRVATRANEEMSELLRALAVDDNHPKATEEIADIVIVLYRIVEGMGKDLQEEIERKMIINRARTWKKDGTGHGYHVRDKQKEWVFQPTAVNLDPDGAAPTSYSVIATRGTSRVEGFGMSPESALADARRKTLELPTEHIREADHA